MFSDYHNEKQASIPSPTYTPSHSPHCSISSTLSISTSCSKKFTELNPPPPYSYIFYNSIDDKPLPPLPTSRSHEDELSPNMNKENKVRFLEQKPLPPLPPSEIEDGDERRILKRRGSGNVEYAWWTKRWNMTDEEYARIAREKERPRDGSLGRFTEDI